MCIFNLPVGGVKETKILVLPASEGRQLTVYQNSVDSDESFNVPTEKSAKNTLNAMILPAPLRQNSKIAVLDLSKLNDLFKELDRCFPEEEVARSSRMEASDELNGSSRSYLPVQSVGAYKISLASNISDLRRIDPNVFSVSPNVDKILGQHYSKNFGFVICGFDPSSGIAPHPIGYVHDRLVDDSGNVKLFVPTRHEHGITHGKDDSYDFDHKIFSVNTVGTNCGQSPEELLQFNKVPAKQKPLFVLAQKVFLPFMLPIRVIRRLIVNGSHTNADYTFDTLPESEIEKARDELQTHLQQVSQLEELKKPAQTTSSTSSTTSTTASTSTTSDSCTLL